MYQESSLDPLTSVRAAPPRLFPGLQERLLPAFLHLYLWVPQSPHLLCQPAPHRAFAPLKVQELVTPQSQAWRALRGTTHAQEGERSKNSAYSVLLTIYLVLPLKLTVCTTFEPTGPHLVGRGDTRYNCNSTGSTKTSDYILEKDQINLSCQCYGCGNCCSEPSTPICLETTPTQLRPYVWPIYVGRAPAKTCGQLRDANLSKTVFLLLTKLPNRPPFPVSTVLQCTQFNTSTRYMPPSQLRAICSCPCTGACCPLWDANTTSCESGHRKNSTWL